LANLSIQYLSETFRVRKLPDYYRVVLIYGLAAFIGILAGVVSADGRPSVIAIFTGLIVAAVVALSRNTLLWFVIVGGLVIFGVAQLYLPAAKYIRYIIPLASVMLVLHGVMEKLGRSRAREAGYNLPGLLLWALGFVAIALVSAVVNRSEPGVAIMGLKGYFQMWPLLLALILIRWDQETIALIVRGLLAIAFLQLPFVLHQYFMLVPLRQGLGDGIVPVDIVSGTFGASLYGGGANAVLAAYLVITVACLLGLWKHGTMSAAKAVLFCVLLLAPLFFNEAKISALYIVLVYVVLFYKEIAAKPLKALLAGVAVAGLFATLLTAFTLAQPSGKFATWNDLIDFTIERQTASTAERSGQFSELSRWTALTFWADEHAGDNLAHLLLGHGPGASRVQEGGLDLAKTLAEQRYHGLQIGYTALSALLWDTGVLGVTAVLGMFLAAFFTAHRLADYYRDHDPAQSGIFDGLSAAVAVLMLSLAHKDFFAFHIPYQTLIILILAYLAIMQRQVSAPRSGQ
jgi:hypothetical protein